MNNAGPLPAGNGHEAPPAFVSPAHHSPLREAALMHLAENPPVLTTTGDFQVEDTREAVTAKLTSPEKVSIDRDAIVRGIKRRELSPYTLEQRFIAMGGDNVPPPGQLARRLEYAYEPIGGHLHPIPYTLSALVTAATSLPWLTVNTRAEIQPDNMPNAVFISKDGFLVYVKEGSDGKLTIFYPAFKRDDLETDEQIARRRANPYIDPGEDPVLRRAADEFRARMGLVASAAEKEARARALADTVDLPILQVTSPELKEGYRELSAFVVAIDPELNDPRVTGKGRLTSGLMQVANLYYSDAPRSHLSLVEMITDSRFLKANYDDPGEERRPNGVIVSSDEEVVYVYKDDVAETITIFKTWQVSG